MRWMVLPWLLACLSVSAQPGLTLLSHDLPPFTEYRDGKLDGFAIRLIDEVQQELGTRYPVRIYPLKRALALARVEPGYGERGGVSPHAPLPPLVPPEEIQHGWRHLVRRFQQDGVA